ncbi:uncharacterized protein LOC127250055 [Andrographis paniculata]|uniref:uncharacterized protein LOC127250055 n=1 Tax=Andrographis paniculata TaxID=175694 RepID=UPI0021E97482|nr:uncharacterized protein LOC127250055 [Andrographis paniculata]XP_051129160.1 uncharacterized protein LOC127250055 [Andrographis paniculata]XP_051129161.1 uncharacterized protein LOC127250055 [Andrographis paniculata]
MDNGQNSDCNQMDGSMVLHLEKKESMRSPDNILVRRLNNRERQRRYRARKRREADLKKASTTDQSISPHQYQHMPAEFVSVPVEVEALQTLTPTDYVTRVHCQRDWKKDARRAHMLEKQESSPVVQTNFEAAVVMESVTKSNLVSSHSTPSIFDNNATRKLVPNRRHWKAEARNRKVQTEHG